MKSFLALCCCIAWHAQAETFNARVIAVIDGDTIMVLKEGHRHKIRLANIDAPEKDQPYGKQSRDSLLAMVGKKQVRVDTLAVDQYGRSIGLVSSDGLDVNQEQVRRGMAWEYSHYHADKTFLALQSDAKNSRRGLWAQDQPLAPWRWRKQHPSSKPLTTDRSVAAHRREMPVMLYDMECGKKHRCAEMVSCEEARFYLVRCGVKALDGNHDGEPCASLCSGQK